ncbi:formiminotransferase N-terminal subdomain-containing protein isoform X5 [Denticeps clupeoides]|uniref:formiminotransferase N-terminal subdomain-containing protein isoform X5 n=1 Tax=Denticeps clupeoides TaxID=299321 RepID=UPI0010A2C398|nr:formiminotransferase N-terminal subdomain-containing protein isoform X5 [Denticeps clupeoides]
MEGAVVARCGRKRTRNRKARKCKSFALRHCRPVRDMAAVGQRLVACMLNISEARGRDVVAQVAHAAIACRGGQWREGTTVLNVFSDEEYNRSVITIVARIDVIALALALTSRVDGTSAFFFGSADVPRNRGLAQRRREMGWFKKVVDMSTIHPDVGPSPQRRYGLTGVGASPYVMNCNVTIDTQDLAVGRKVAAALRESGEAGLPGIQVLALPHEGAVEIACNVKSIPCSSSWAGTVPWPAFSISGRAYHHVPARLITARVAQLAGTHGVAVRGTALVGFTPRECRVLAEWALTLGIGEFWTKQHQLYM